MKWLFITPPTSWCHCLITELLTDVMLHWFIVSWSYVMLEVCDADVATAAGSLNVVGAGMLCINSVQLSDSGLYECTWNSTSDHVVNHVNLSVISECCVRFSLANKFFNYWLIVVHLVFVFSICLYDVCFVCIEGSYKSSSCCLSVLPTFIFSLYAFISVAG